MLDASIASALRKMIDPPVPLSEEESVLKSSELKKYNRFLRGRSIACMIYGHFQSTGACDTAQGLSGLFSICLQDDDVQDFDTRWGQISLGRSEVPPENVLEGLLQEQITRFRTTSNSICNVQSRFESRSRGDELSTIEENGKTTH